jgi:ubiquinone/menaquinone biosynthesis C-methylase UbiE
MNNFTESNKKLWDGWTKVNAKSDFYNLNAFKSGVSSLKKIELTELGNVKGKSLLHLQCHFGLDTLSWAREGAMVTGVDFSTESINLASQLSKELAIPAEFICSDIYELPQVLDKKFDIVFTSYGVLVWLCNLNKWADVVAHFLKPGGTFYIVEFHPFTNMFDQTWHHLNDSYFYSEEPLCLDQKGSYADNDAEFDHVSYEWPHTMGEVVTALREVGLITDFFHEFPYSAYNCFPSLEQSNVDEYVIQGQQNKIPLMYSIKATYMPQLALRKS